jgi:hypothetical protein
MKIIGFIAAAGAAVALSLAFSGCGATDVVGRVANTSFRAVVEASGGRVAPSEEGAAWALASPEGDRLLVSSDFSKSSPATGSATSDIGFEFDAGPFLTAGFDIDKLPPVEGIRYELQGGKLTLHFELGGEAFVPEAKKSMEAAFAEIVRTQRTRIGYHEQLDHYGIKLGDGNMFEWAKDLQKNDKDIVWVLNPGPFIAAGADPSKIQGWVFAKVEMKDDAGKTILVDKLLKPFDLL